MINYLYLGSTQLADTSVRSLTSIDGLDGPTGPRGDPWLRPEEDGAIEPAQQFLTPRIVVLEGEIWGSTVDAVWTDWRTVSAAFYDALSTDTLLKWQSGTGGPEVQAYVRLASEAVPRIQAGEFLRLVYQVQFRAGDPRWYSQTESSSTPATAPTAIGGIPFPIPFPIPFGSGVVGGSTSVTNNGTVSTWPRIEIAGPIINPIVSNTTRNETIYFDGLTLTAGQTLVVTTDPRTRAATVSGATVVGSIRWSDSVFPRLSPGANTIQFSGSATAGTTSMTVYWRDAYL